MTMEGEKGERDISTNARQIMITSDIGEKPFVFICVTRQWLLWQTYSESMINNWIDFLLGWKQFDRQSVREETNTRSRMMRETWRGRS